MNIKSQPQGYATPSVKNTASVLMGSPSPNVGAPPAETVVKKETSLSLQHLETVETKDDLDAGLVISTAEFRGDQPGDFIRAME